MAMNQAKNPHRKAGELRNLGMLRFAEKRTRRRSNKLP